ncbi:BTAD domain-containing putative transcriptional regulator [Streptosporangium sp. NPDC006013]|uniref:BTAD domain-containing putative transcriptional regulator n=1 Tax=Streptosporangium sp. NPDC006013 TaxID=3155596 RepID=UPI0033A2E3AB
MRFDVLGPTRIRLDDGRAVVVGGPRMRALLVMLLLDVGKVVTTERLIGGLYGADPPAGVANALQSQVSRLRRALGAQEVIEFHPAGYRLVAGADAVDAHRFGRLAAEGRRLLASGDCGRAVEPLGEALSLWRGPVLADVAEFPFAQAPSARLEELRLDCVEDRLQAELELGRHRELVAELQELTAAHPLRERLYGQLMRALYGSGRQVEALEVYDRARRVLGEEFGVDPSAELAAVHLAVLRADPELAGAPAAGAPPLRSGLRAPLTSFVGREGEMSELRALLGEARLVTLVGPGGAGKTRLAGEVAAGEQGEVCFVELAPVFGGGEVAQAVLGAMGVRDARLFPGPGRPVPTPLARLVAALADRPLLLVLDNCEHLVAEAAELADRLLAACPALRVLATSREALGITGEVIHPVAPLPVPRAGTAAGEATAYPAVRLLADRAAAVRPGFRVDDTNVEQVLDICRALDGLPLALELAAARLRSLSVTEVASRLGDRFRLLSRGSRTALPRHQTLRAVVAWSWDLLDDDERSLAGRLAVFVGGATLEAVGRVCGLPEAEAVDLLSSLAEKSLIERVGGRYRMLETIRAYCAERLAEAGETEARREAHASYYTDLAATADRRLRGAGQLEWLRRLDEERDDLHAALRWAIDTGRTGQGLRLLAGLAMYWWMRGRRWEGAGLATDLLGVIGPAPVEGLEEEYAICVLVAFGGESRSPRLLALLEATAPLVPAIDQPYRWPFLAMLQPMFTGPVADLRSHLPRIPAIADPWVRALSHFGCGYLQLYDGNAGGAERSFEDALELFGSIGERWGSALTLAELAELADLRQDVAASRALADEALRLVEELESAEDIADFICRRALGIVREGDLATAHAEYLRAAVYARRAGTPDVMAKVWHGLAEIARLRGELDEARTLAREALDLCPQEWYAAEETRLRITVELGRIATSSGDGAGARAWYREALEPALHRYLLVAGSAIGGLAEVVLLENDVRGAARLLGAATALSGAAAAHPDAARVTAAVRARIGGAAYEKEWRAGTRMSRSEVLSMLEA